MNTNLAVGLFDVLIFAIFFTINFRLLWILIRNKNFARIWAYKIIFQIGIVDGLLLSLSLLTGLMCLTNNGFAPIYARVGMLVHIVGHEMEGLLSVNLALNRLFVMLQIRKLNKPWLYWLLTIHTIISGITCVLFFDRDGTPFYNFEKHEFDLIYNRVGGEVSRKKLLKILLYVCFGYFTIGLVCYSIITAFIIKKRQTVSKNDTRIFIQALLPFLYLVIFKIIFYMPWIFTDNIRADVAPLIYTLFTRTVPCTHMISYIVFNKSLRISMFSIFRLPVKAKKRSTINQASMTFF